MAPLARDELCAGASAISSSRTQRHLCSILKYPKSDKSSGVLISISSIYKLSQSSLSLWRLLKPNKVRRMSQNLEIVRLQGFREQFRITIPREMIEKLKWQKGQPLFISLEGTKIVVEPVIKR